MAQKNILVIDEDKEVEKRLNEILGKDFILHFVPSLEQAANQVLAQKPDLILLDFDLKQEDGLQVFYKLSNIVRDVKVVMLTYSGSIPLAVKATKAGVADFLQKPLNTDHVKETINRNLSQIQEKIIIPSKYAWLHGESQVLKEFLQDVQNAMAKNADVIVFGEKGIRKQEIAQIIHLNSKHKKRRLVSLNLTAFPKEMLETYFWTLLQKLIGFPDPSFFQEEEALCGTVYLENIEFMDPLFVATLLDLLSNRGDKLDRSVKVVISVTSLKLDTKEFSIIHAPSLRKRKEDLGQLIGLLLDNLALKYDKPIKYLATSALNFLNGYDYPGNYVEIEKMLEVAMLACDSEKIELKDLPFSLAEFGAVAIKEAQEQNATLAEALAKYEKKLYQLLLDKLGKDSAAAAKFLDIPLTIFEKRCFELSRNLVN